MSEDTYDHLEGTEIGEGEITVARWEAFLWADATENDEDAFRYEDEAAEYGADSQLVPPEYGLTMANDAIDADLEDLGLDPDTEKGMFHAGQEFEFYQPIVVDETYTVSGTLTDVDRKDGGSGTFDLVEQTFEITDETGEPVLETVTKAILMR